MREIFCERFLIAFRFSDVKMNEKKIDYLTNVCMPPSSSSSPLQQIIPGQPGEKKKKNLNSVLILNENREKNGKQNLAMQKKLIK